MANKKKENSSKIVKFDMEAAKLVSVRESLEELIGPGELDLGILPKITLKHAGTVAFGMPDVEDPDGEVIVDGKVGFNGVLLVSQAIRVYWDTPFDERDQDTDILPTCSSLDIITGVVRDNGQRKECKTCPLSEWGSARKGGGQACSERRRLFLLPEGNLMPHTLTAPSSSIKSVDSYRAQVIGKSLAYWETITHFGAVNAVNREGIEFTRLAMNIGGSLTPEDQAGLLPFRTMCQRIAEALPVTEDVAETSQDDFKEEGDKEEVFEDE